VARRARADQVAQVGPRHCGLRVDTLRVTAHRADARARTAVITRQPEGNLMNAATLLHETGQSIWLDNITRALLDSGTLAGFIADASVTGLTSNPTIFDKAITGSSDYDDAMRAASGRAPEDVFFDLAIDDLRRAAQLFGPRYDESEGVDGWVSLEVSPRLAHDTASTVAEAKLLHARAETPNLYIKVPGTPEGIPAIEELIFSGVPVNVTLLFSPDHYVAAAGAYTRGLERRREAGLDLRVSSVASLFVSRWDVAVTGKLPAELSDRLGIAIGIQAYRAYRDVLASPRWTALEDSGARPQRLLFASTGTKDPALPDTFYITALAAEQTINTMPQNTLEAFVDHGEVKGVLSPDGGDADATIAGIAAAGIDIDALAARLQKEGAESFVKSWNDLLARVESKTATVSAG
jgi:transaldolase